VSFVVIQDAWDELVQLNSTKNAGLLNTEYFESAIAAKDSMQIKINTVTCQRELKELEDDQQLLAARIAVIKDTRYHYKKSLIISLIL
jgi:hypothetical protein